MAALINDGHVVAKQVGEHVCHFHIADIRAHHHAFTKLVAQGKVMLSKHRGGGEVIHRDVKEPLNLRSMQIHAQDAVAAGASDQVGHQFGGNRHAPLILAILTRVAKVRNDRGNSPSAGAA